MVLCKFHSVFLSECGRVLTCGHGLGGRLGHGSEQSLVVSLCVCVWGGGLRAQSSGEPLCVYVWGGGLRAQSSGEALCVCVLK